MGIAPLPQNLHDAIARDGAVRAGRRDARRARLRLLPAQQARRVGGVPPAGHAVRAASELPVHLVQPSRRVASAHVRSRDRLLVIQHEDDCPPAWFGEWFRCVRARRTTSCSPIVQPSPAVLGAYAGLVVLGGEMGAADDADCAWLASDEGAHRLGRGRRQTVPRDLPRSPARRAGARGRGAAQPARAGARPDAARPHPAGKPTAARSAIPARQPCGAVEQRRRVPAPRGGGRAGHLTGRHRAGGPVRRASVGRAVPPGGVGPEVFDTWTGSARATRQPPAATQAAELIRAAGGVLQRRLAAAGRAVRRDRDGRNATRSRATAVAQRAHERGVSEPTARRQRARPGRLARLGFDHVEAAEPDWPDVGIRGPTELLEHIAAGRRPRPGAPSARTTWWQRQARTRPTSQRHCAATRAGAARCALVLGASAALGDHLVRHPDDWHELADPELDAVRVRPPRGWPKHSRKADRPRRAATDLPSAAAAAGCPRPVSLTSCGSTMPPPSWPTSRRGRSRRALRDRPRRAGPSRGRPVHAQRHRHGQVRSTRAQLRQRRRRHLRRRAGRRRRRGRCAARPPLRWRRR